jgi:lipopolysaccharide transport system permease protein
VQGNGNVFEVDSVAGWRASMRRTWDLLASMAKADILVRYGRGRVRFVKWMLDPIAALGVYLALIVFVFDFGGTAPGLSLVCAIVPFQLVMASTVNALQAMRLRRSILANMAFDRTLIPLASVATETIALTASLTLIPLMMAIYGVAPTISILWLPVTFAVTIAFAVAIAYPASLVGTWYPEMLPFGASVVRAMFFLAPGLIALDQVSGTARELLPINPLTGIFESFRDALLYGQAPAAWELLVPLGAALLLLGVTLPLYRREQAYFPKLVA